MFKSSKRGANKKNAIVSLLLVAALVITGALAFLTSKDNAENKFTVGNVDISLTEPLWDAANPDGTLENIVAGQVIAKDPTITNTGRNDAYVYMMVEIPKVYKTDIVGADGTMVTNEEHYPLFSFAVNEGWTLVDSQTCTETDAYDYYLYAYNTELAPDGAATLFNEVAFANITENFINEITGEAIVDLNVKVTAYAIQSDFYNEEAADAASAWALYAKQNDWKWPINQYEGLVDVNYLNENDELINTDTVYAGTPVTMYFEPSLAKTGYTFDWVNEATGEVAYSGMTVEADTNLKTSYTETGYDTEGSDFINYTILNKSEETDLSEKRLAFQGIRTDVPNRPTEATTVVIPATINATVTDISLYGTNADYDYYSLTLETNQVIDNVILPDGYELNEVLQIPVTEISTASLAYNDDHLLVKTLVLPDSINIINDAAFWPSHTGTADDPNTVLEEIVLPYGVTTINELGLSYCSALKSIDLPNSITTIGEQAFRFDTALESITISSSLNHLPDDVFQGCENIKSVTFKDNCVMTEIEEAFRLCANLTSVDFGENSRLTTIGEYAFQSCPIESVVIPSSVTEIEQGAFSGGVKSITFEENSQLTTIGQNAFANGLYTNIDLPETVTSIEKYAFRASALESITIPGSIKNIPSSCFRNCEAPTNVILDVGVENIESLAFYNCSALNNIVIPNTVTTIGNQVFYGCNSLGTIRIPVSVTEIDSAFLGRLSGTIIINYEGTEEQWLEATGGKTLSGVSSPTINYQS